MVSYAPDGSRAAHERMDDEVMVIDLVSGAYYSLRGASADCWSLIAAGHDQESTATEVARRYGVEPSIVAGPLASMIDTLVADGVLVPEERTADTAAAVLPEPPTTPYATPQVEKFTDMQELLLLDPIHEVTDAGWPSSTADT